MTRLVSAIRILGTFLPPGLYVLRDYVQLSESSPDIEKLQHQFKSYRVPFDIKMFVGELLGEREINRSAPLKKILSKCQPVIRGTDKDYTVENIFEIYKTLDTLNPTEFIDVEFEKLNFNDVDTDKIVAFVKDALDSMSLDVVLAHER